MSLRHVPHAPGTGRRPLRCPGGLGGAPSNAPGDWEAPPQMPRARCPRLCECDHAA
jgi:hypothetical protein